VKTQSQTLDTRRPMSTGVLDPGRPAGRQLKDTVQHGLHDARGVRRALRTSSEHGAAHLGLTPPRPLRMLWEALLLPVFGGGVPDSEPADCRAAVFTCILSLERRVGEGQIGQCGHELPEGGHEGEL